MTLPAAARQLRVPWGRAWRLLLLGKLDGRQDPRGRWEVTVASVRALQKASDNGVAVARVS